MMIPIRHDMIMYDRDDEMSSLNQESRKKKPTTRNVVHMVEREDKSSTKNISACGSSLRLSHSLSMYMYMCRFRRAVANINALHPRM